MFLFLPHKLFLWFFIKTQELVFLRPHSDTEKTACGVLLRGGFRK